MEAAASEFPIHSLVASVRKLHYKSNSQRPTRSAKQWSRVSLPEVEGIPHSADRRNTCIPLCIGHLYEKSWSQDGDKRKRRRNDNSRQI